MNATDAELVWRAVCWLTAQPRGSANVRVWAACWANAKAEAEAEAEAEADATHPHLVIAGRDDIAQYAGTTAEQVSRSLVLLEDVKAIKRVHDRGRRPRGRGWRFICMTPEFRFPRV